MFRCLIISVFILAVSALQADYYWRDYDGEVPSDAVPVESDVSAGKRTFIGQGLIRNHGIFIGQILPRKEELVLAAWGVRTTTSAVKILCTGHPKNLYWHPTNATRFFDEVDAVHKFPVVGGLDQADLVDEVIHVGRYKDNEGNWNVGIIGGNNPHYRKFFYASGEVQVRRLEFEVLIYNAMIHGNIFTKYEVIPEKSMNDKESYNQYYFYNFTHGVE